MECFPILCITVKRFRLSDCVFGIFNKYIYFKMHPNWRALATASYKYQPFVSGRQENHSKEVTINKREHHLVTLSGEDVSNYYEEVVNTPSTPSSLKKRPPKREIIKIRTSTNLTPTTANFNRFCREVLANNVDEVHRIGSSQPEYINQTDNFGWTPLMMAACEGASGSFTILLQLGANLSLKNKKGQTAFTLAQTKNHHEIFLAIKEHYQKRTNNEEIENPGLNRHQPFFCELCVQEFVESTFREHQTSTLHQFNLEHHEFPTRFGLSETNRGFQMMIRQGWNKRSGLGPTSSGHLFPVKTSIREFRTGLGVEQPDEPRVTHFKPNDVAAIKRRNMPKPYTGRDRERDLNKNRRRERRLRNELS